MYLLAYVPEYESVRTFAVDRIASVSLEKGTFTPRQAVADDVFANSLGVNTGPADRVEIRFSARVAPYVRARVWHASQQIRDEDGGDVTLTMDVCHDWALRSWILQWGRYARVLTPGSLAHEVAEDLEAASANYASPPVSPARHAHSITSGPRR
jgi:proteasome accessory factor B